MPAKIIKDRIGRKRGEAIELGIAPCRSGQFSFRLVQPDRVAFKTVDGLDLPLILGQRARIEGEFHIDATLDASKINVSGEVPLAEFPGVLDVETGSVATKVVAQSWRRLADQKPDAIHRARHDVIDDVILTILNARNALSLGFDRGDNATLHEIRELDERIDKIAGLLNDSLDMIEDRPGFVISVEGRLIATEIGLRSGFMGKLTMRLRPDAGQIATAKRGTIHRIRIVDGVVRLMTPEGYESGFVGEDPAPWPSLTAAVEAAI